MIALFMTQVIDSSIYRSKLGMGHWALGKTVPVAAREPVPSPQSPVPSSHTS
ncbi:MAG: hypothetical protein V7L26_14390 [Nostoc sp.]|uniref:hypothetical protein n=1 Tax=Nostoc sp. TaxID=1180 RepID=UPI002FF8D753